MSLLSSWDRILGQIPDFQVCWYIHGLLWWENCVLMMPMYFGFFCLWSCACLLPCGYLWCLLVWVTPLLSLGCFRSPGRPVALAVSDHLWGIPTGVFLQGLRSCWSVTLATVDFLGVFQTVGSSMEQSSHCLTVLSAADPQLLWVQRVLNCSECSRSNCSKCSGSSRMDQDIKSSQEQTN